MNKITNITDLKLAISQLEDEQAVEWPLLKARFIATYDSLKPLNLIKNTFREITSSPDIKDNFLGTAVGLTTGYLSKAIITGSSHNPIKKILGSFLQLGVSNFVARHPETIKLLLSKATAMFSKNGQATTLKTDERIEGDI